MVCQKSDQSILAGKSMKVDGAKGLANSCFRKGGICGTRGRRRYGNQRCGNKETVGSLQQGSPQGGPLSPLLANIYLNEFDHEFENRGVKVIRYADDIVLLAKSQRATERLLETNTRYLESKLKLTVNREKSKTVSLTSTSPFLFARCFIFLALRNG